MFVDLSPKVAPEGAGEKRYVTKLHNVTVFEPTMAGGTVVDEEKPNEPNDENCAAPSASISITKSSEYRIIKLD